MNNLYQSPLISIIVITYNSANYVIETLESAKAQTYQNIELIVSDDCSDDNTVEICRKWIVVNKERFVRSELITVEKNTGIPANCNRGVKAAQGEWVKLIAGDDILIKDSITKLVEHLKLFPEIRILTGNMFKFISPDISNGEATKMHLLPFYNNDSTSKEQYQYLLRYNRVLTPPSIIQKEIIEELGYFDETYRMIEDYPFWIKATENGNKIFTLSDVLVYYRIHENAISQGNSIQYRIQPVNKILLQLQQKYILKRLPLIEKIGLIQEIISKRIILRIGNKRNGIFENLVYYSGKYTNIFAIYRHLCKLINKEYINNQFVKTFSI